MFRDISYLARLAQPSILKEHLIPAPPHVCTVVWIPRIEHGCVYADRACIEYSSDCPHRSDRKFWRTKTLGMSECWEEFLARDHLKLYESARSLNVYPPQCDVLCCRCKDCGDEFVFRRETMDKLL